MMSGRDRDRQTDRDRERQRQRETGRQTDRQRQNNEDCSNDRDKSTSKKRKKKKREIENRKQLNDKNSRTKVNAKYITFIINNGKKSIRYADRKSNKHSYTKRVTRHYFTLLKGTLRRFILEPRTDLYVLIFGGREFLRGRERERERERELCAV